jgi:hypothetical protein
VPDNDNSPKWPDLTIAFTFVTAVVFLASLLFIFGLSRGIHHNLLGLCDLSDYLRVAPSWALPSLGLAIFMTLCRWGDYRPNQPIQKKEWRSRVMKALSWWKNSNSAQFSTFIVMGLIASVFQAIYKDAFSALIAALSFALGIHYLSHIAMTGWTHVFRWPFRFAFFIPRTVLLLAFSFWLGTYWLPIYGYSFSTRVVTMKDHSQYTGRVVLELSRYLLIQKPDGHLVAIQTAEIEAMELGGETSGGAPTFSPSSTASPATPSKPN